MKFGRNSTMEKSPIRRLLSRGNTSPLPNFDVFFLGSRRHTPPPIGHLRRIRVFYPWRRLRCAAPVTHQDQGLRTSRRCARRLPLASWMPQKTLGSLPCPIVYSVQIAWLPHGSNFHRAPGRGVASLGHSAAGSLSEVETGTNQIGWVSTNFSPSLRPQPNGRPALSQKLSSPQRAPGLASCNNKRVPTYGPRPSGPGPCCCGSWPACVDKIAGLPAESAGQTAPPPYRPTPNTGCHF